MLKRQAVFIVKNQKSCVFPHVMPNNTVAKRIERFNFSKLIDADESEWHNEEEMVNFPFYYNCHAAVAMNKKLRHHHQRRSSAFKFERNVDRISVGCLSLTFSNSQMTP